MRRRPWLCAVRCVKGVVWWVGGVLRHQNRRKGERRPAVHMAELLLLAASLSFPHNTSHERRKCAFYLLTTLSFSSTTTYPQGRG